MSVIENSALMSKTVTYRFQIKGADTGLWESTEDFSSRSFDSFESYSVGYVGDQTDDIPSFPIGRANIQFKIDNVTLSIP